MNNNLVNEITASQIRHDLPEFSSGDEVRVSVRIIEGNKSRIQNFQGVVICRRGGGVSETFTVRKMSSGIGVERTFPINSPVIAGIQVIRRGKVRRNKSLTSANYQVNQPVLKRFFNQVHSKRIRLNPFFVRLRVASIR